MIGPREAEVELRDDTEIVVRRAFAAPADLVFAAFTVPKLMQRWLLGYPGWTMPVCDVDLRPGGTYRQRWRETETGNEFGFKGVYHEIDAPNRIVQAEVFEDDPSWGENNIITTFDAVDGGTLVTMIMRFDTPEARQAAMETGMTDGMESSYKMLDAELAGGGIDA